MDLSRLPAARVVFDPLLNSRTSGSRAVGSWGIICQLALVPTSFPCPSATPPVPDCPSSLSHTRSLSPSCQRKGRSLAESGGHRAPSPVQDPSLWLRGSLPLSPAHTQGGVLWGGAGCEGRHVCAAQRGVCASPPLRLVRAPGPLTSGAQGHTVASPIPRLPSGPVSKIPATPIGPTKCLVY